LWTYFPSQAALTVIVIVSPPATGCGPGSTDPNCLNANTLPGGGFAPNRVTSLAKQPADKAYSQLGDLWLEIPSQNVQQNIIGVPNNTGGWDVSWLGNDIGYLEGTAFPTWAGNSVLVGHVYDVNGKPGPFINIGKMGWGQQIIIHGWGQRYVYEVRTVNNWVYPNDTQLITRHEIYPWITLVTCHGYDAKSNSYEYRTIVRAIQVKVESDN
jgi:LPXTG-site transpeptidase (sortase) family protein